METTLTDVELFEKYKKIFGGWEDFAIYAALMYGNDMPEEENLESIPYTKKE